MTMKALGVDVGGTFTDCLMIDRSSGEIHVAKVPTTNSDQVEGFLAGLDQLKIDDVGELHTIVHGTTITTNAVLERKGALCGLITTRGFRDVLELERRTRPHVYGLHGEFEALVSRNLRLEVTERMDAEGQVLNPLYEDEIPALVEQFRKAKVEAIIIHFINAYANPAHERRCAEIVRSLWPEVYITVGTEVISEIREFERGNTAAVNGYVQPLIGGYIKRLVKQLRDRGAKRDLLIMQGNGGMMNAGIAAQHAAQTVMSGPAAGAIATGLTGQQAGFSHLIACDMGGTSFDVSVVVDGKPSISRERELDYAMPVHVPLIDIHTVGSGGGSIASVNSAGILQVGPESAGAQPGAVAYGRGGTRPTVTDANLLLGRVNPAALTGVSGDADIAAVSDAIEKHVGEPLGLEPISAADAILAVVNNAMAGAIRFISIEKGLDPRDFTIVAFGGAGPLHSCALARELGIPKVLVPRYPGINCALGCIMADVRHDFGQTVARDLSEVSGQEADKILQSQVAEGEALIKSENIEVTSIKAFHEADLLYAGQSHIIRIEVPSPGFDAEQVRLLFANLYRERFEIELPEMRPVLMALRTTIIGARETLDLNLFSNAEPDQTIEQKPIDNRRVYFAGQWHDTPVFRREHLSAGFKIEGPAIVEQVDTTTLIEPVDSMKVDLMGNLIIEVGGYE